MAVVMDKMGTMSSNGPKIMKSPYACAVSAYVASLWQPSVEIRN
jgi:hypothetical protein